MHAVARSIKRESVAVPLALPLSESVEAELALLQICIYKHTRLLS